jgi:NTP pyrophosphatase (non-canonical NTP hydrolase)
MGDLKRILLHFGVEAQMRKTIEECAELIRAIANADRKNIIEEIADVKIMLAQMELAFGIGDDVKCMQRRKIDRALKYIDNSNKNESATCCGCSAALSYQLIKLRGDLSQRKLADELGISGSLIGRMERRECKLSDEVREKYESYFKKTLPDE